MTQPRLQPILVGPNVTLRPLRADDWNAMFAAASDPAIWSVHPEPRRYEEKLFRIFFDSGLASGAALTIVSNETGAIIGSSRYFGHDERLWEIEIGWTFLTRPHWGGVANREIKQLMLEHAFDFVDTVIFWVGANNVRSRRAMEKIGGRLRDEVRVREYSSGPCTHVIYEIRKDRGPSPAA